ncbi:hypothetical protein HN873_024046, partial [Arachis hypogaea]
NGRHRFFASGLARLDANGEDPFGDSRRIACKRCGGFHVWIHTKKQKSRARWCQVDTPAAYVCADSRIYNQVPFFRTCL